jgi:DNA-binding NarL/FixJ family response regulator
VSERPIDQQQGSTEAEHPVAPTTLEWPARVLIVDDAASTRAFLRAVLEHRREFEVIGEADNGATAVDLAEALKPDVVLLDLSMPGTDGASALGALLRVAPHARVIIVSGTDPDAAPLLAAGATALIPKGLAPFELLDRLGGILKRPVSLERSEPVVAAPVRPVAGPVAPVHAPTPLAPIRHRAVICDDDAMTRRLVAQVLASCELTVVAETDVVPNLLAVIELAKPELVVLDLWLEGTGGTSALPEIRALSPSTVVVVYSAYSEWKDKALAAGAAAFVAKPHFDQLAAAIRGLLASAAA